MQLDALAVVRPDVTDVRIWGRNAEHARACADDVTERFGGDVTVRASSTVDAAIEAAQVVITCTAAHEAMVRADRLAAGAHVTALGSDGAGKQELDPEILRRADVLVVDSRDQCATLGELQHAPDQRDRAVDLARSARGRGGRPARASSPSVTDRRRSAYVARRTSSCARRQQRSSSSCDRSDSVGQP